MKRDGTGHHKVICTSFNSILRDHYNTFSHLPLENYYVVTKSKTKVDRTQLPKVYGVDKVVNGLFKPETQVNREGLPRPISVIPESVSQPQRIIPPSLPRKGQGIAGVRRN